MKYLFIIQGEGRGHLTQSIALKNILEKNGHELVAVMVGRSQSRSLPVFFTDKIQTAVIPFRSPNFLPAPKGKTSFLPVSIAYNVLLLPVYIKSVIQIRQVIHQLKPDIVVNFYELMCGITYGIFGSLPPMVNVAHQYYFLTPLFNYKGKKRGEFRLLNFFSSVTALNSSKILALSFREESPMSFGKVTIVPPLLRREVIEARPEKGDFILGYLLNNGYADELKTWSENNPMQKLIFFWDKKGVQTETRVSSSLAFYTLNDQKFIQMMARCEAYATTGGFESVCEAMYLQKPVLMVPTHIEQECNVQDAIKSHAGVGAGEFRLDILQNLIPYYEASTEFRYWANAARAMFLYEMTHLENKTAFNIAY